MAGNLRTVMKKSAIYFHPIYIQGKNQKRIKEEEGEGGEYTYIKYIK